MKSTPDREEIRFTRRRTSLGLVFAAASERGVCLLQLIEPGADTDAVRELRRLFPLAALREDDAAFATLFEQVEMLAGGGDVGEVALDLRGTAFQQKVWQALRRVPRGGTVTYTELAERAGAPRAVRAAASACARNPVALFVPCHRIVRRDGGLGGYRWGLERKRRLLEAERPLTPA